MKKIIVTGGTGLVGQALKKVVGNDSRFFFLSSKDCNLLQYDKAYETIKSIQPDFVVHLAANVGGVFKNINKKVEMFEDNLLINFNILKICRELNVEKFLGCLSTCIFPDKTTYPISEEMLFNGPPHYSNYGYAYSKRMLEIHCRVCREQYGLNYNCIIPTNIYGPYDNFNFENAHVIPALIHKCYLANQTNEPFVVSGTGRPKRQFLYSIDLAKIILNLINFEFNETIIISPSEEFSIKDVAEIIANKFNYIENIKFDTTKSDGQYKKTASNYRLMKIMPDFKFTEISVGLNSTIDWFLDNQSIARL